MGDIDAFAADADGNPVHRSASFGLPNGGAFAGWHRLERQDRPFVATANHNIGTLLYAFHYWFWSGGGDPVNHHSWSGRVPQPGEAGPAAIVTTANYIYFHFLPDRPVFSLFDSAAGSFRPLNSGWIGVLVTPG